MILNFEEMRLKLLRGEVTVNPYSSTRIEEAMLIARDDALREVYEFVLAHSTDAVVIDQLYWMRGEVRARLREGA